MSSKNQKKLTEKNSASDVIRTLSEIVNHQVQSRFRYDVNEGRKGLQSTFTTTKNHLYEKAIKNNTLTQTVKHPQGYASLIPMQK